MDKNLKEFSKHISYSKLIQGDLYHMTDMTSELLPRNKNWSSWVLVKYYGRESTYKLLYTKLNQYLFEVLAEAEFGIMLYMNKDNRVELYRSDMNKFIFFPVDRKDLPLYLGNTIYPGMERELKV